MKNLITLSFLLITLMFSGCATAQMGYGTKSKKAIKLYEEAQRAPNQNINVNTGLPNYSNGIEILKKALKIDENFLEAHQLIGEFYRLSGKSKEAVYHYKRSLQIRPTANLNGQLYIDIADLQIKNREFDDAIAYCDLVINSRDRRISELVMRAAQIIKEDAEFSKYAYNHPLDIKLQNIGKGINTNRPEYFPTITVDGKTMLFTRELETSQRGPRGQEDFFVSELTPDGMWGRAVPMPSNINTIRNEGAPTISADGRTLIFVACADETGSYGDYREGKGSCDLFVTERIGNKWSDPVNLPGYVNTYSWESQPSLAADGKTLYFIRKVGSGRTAHSDIFMSEKLADGSWGRATPLPDNINTPGMETSVLIHPDGQTLYFASDGHTGLGGSDIFMSRKDPLGKWGDPINLGYPINTEDNENSLLVGPDGDVAFFASDRPGGEGDLDIYYFELPKELRPIKTTYFEGLVYDAVTRKPIQGQFELVDLSNGKTVVESKADPVTGEFLVALPTKKQYALSVSYPGYAFFSKNFDMIEGEDAVHMDVPMVPLTDDQPILLANVFFDLNKSTLRPESFVELNKLADLLAKNGKIKVEVGGHTDTRGDAKSNQKLSEDRAKSVYDYLIEKGVEANRLTYKGYGATQPIISDNEISKLSTEEAKEKAHQENRRTEYRIIK
ncbi:MAG: PD40 domain-containing protein [Brumimicrobium sp.]|nr:PD40 domain-containing protein [Brumimicrobium sp.]